MNVAGGVWSKYKTIRRRVLRFLISEQNRQKHEAVFEEDYERLKEYGDAIEFIKSMDFDEYKKKQVCPICGSEEYTYGEVSDVMFYGFNDKELGKLEKLTILKCEECGFYSILDW